MDIEEVAAKAEVAKESGEAESEVIPPPENIGLYTRGSTLVTGKLALVAVSDAHLAFDKLYSYAVPASLADKAVAGVRVNIPFGAGGRRTVGMLCGVETAKYDTAKVKRLSDIPDEQPILPPDLIKLAVWMSENTFTTMWNCLSAMSVLNLKNTALPKGRHAGQKYMVRLSPLYIENDAPKLTPKQRLVVQLLTDVGSADTQEVCYNCGVTAAVVSRLVKNGVLEMFLCDIPAEGEIDTSVTETIVFSPSQQKVFDGLLALLNMTEPKCALLRGVTGSGKTSVFIRLMQECLSQGKTAIMLVPEIALTPQMMRGFTEVFGSDVAVLHSGLSIKERREQHKRLYSGKAKIALGTRSAVFAPLDNIGLIIMDEEHESSYKSDRSPRYHARDVAKQRCFHHGAFLLLASATPSVESYYFAKSGRYSLFELTERYNRTQLPSVEIADRAADGDGTSQIKNEIGGRLLQLVSDTLAKGEQAIILLNRRGYSTYISCTQCCTVLKCPHCDVTLNYHKSNGRVLCHYCGYNKPLPDSCPECKCAFIKQSGAGTQRIEEELLQRFPNLRLLRMDRDTVYNKTAYEKGFTAFKNGEYDLLVGTQMIAKGLDFPNVTLVGVLGTDRLLFAGDFRGYERVFSLITQVIGRCGRGDAPGRAVIETYVPDNYLLKLAAAQDYTGFYEQEILLRGQFGFPPFCDVCIVTCAAVSESSAADAADAFARCFSVRAKDAGIKFHILGPVKFGTGSTGGKHKVGITIKCKNNRALRRVVRDVLWERRSVNKKERRYGISITAYFDN